jgi:LPXTG-motif cell wall-anchored protein
MGTIYTGDSVLLETSLPPPRQVETAGTSSSLLTIIGIAIVGIILYFTFRGK